MAEPSATKTIRRPGLLAAIRKQEHLVLDLQAAGGGIADAETKATAKLAGLYNRYESTLTQLPLSRCPVTGQVVVLAIDVRGLDGPYWNAERPIRPVQVFPQTLFAYCGAIETDGARAAGLHVLRPGPGRPFIVPRIMAIEGMNAVISKLKIGKDEAFAIFYFHPDPPYDHARVNYWGADYHAAEWQEGKSYVLDVPDLEPDFDFDVQSWIADGRVYWIEPRDKNLQLKSDAAGYPFAGAAGRAFPVRIQDGIARNSIYLAPSDDRSDAA